MSENYVTVTASWGDGTNVGQGNYLFHASGALMDGTATAIVTPVLDDVLKNGALSVQLLASDNYGAGELSWDCTIRIKGFSEIKAQGLIVNHATGATQVLFDILEANGWAPMEIP